MIELTIGMAVYQDFDGVYFTVQDLRLHHDMENVEILVVDNFGCNTTAAFVAGTGLNGPGALPACHRQDRHRRSAAEGLRGGAARRCCAWTPTCCWLPAPSPGSSSSTETIPARCDLYQGPLLYDGLDGCRHAFRSNLGRRHVRQMGVRSACRTG